MKASNALESMATDNYNCQKAFLELDAPRVLIKLLKVSAVLIDLFHIVISLSNRSSIEKSIKPFLKMKGQIAY